jgi:hypothetical protein
MDLIVLIIFIYAISKALKDARAGWRKSKGAYMRSVDARFPSLPKPRRAARAAQHDLGYWTAHALRGFPHARRGFAAGWQEGRQAKAGGKPLLWRDVKPPEGEVRPAAGAEESVPAAPAVPALVPAAPAAPEPRVCAACGNPENGPRKGGGNWGPLVLYRENDPAAAAGLRNNPYLAHKAHFDDESTGFYGRPYEPADPHACGNPNGCACPCHGASAEPELPGLPAHQPSGNQTAVKGTPVMAATADITYNSQMDQLTKMRDDSDRELTEAKVKLAMASLSVDSLIGMRVGAGTISHAESRREAYERQVEAAQEALDAAEAGIASLQREHGGIQEAVDNSPVHLPAEPEFYSA